MERRQLGRGQKALTSVVVAGTLMIAVIGFVGSYDAVLKLAQRNGFGWFSYLLPIGIDVGITVFLALDLLLTWMRIPLALLRQLAWVLTAATIVFNAASAWPRPLSTGMHAVVPLLFVAAIEAARHTVGRLAQIEANQLMERTRLGRWVFAPVATFRLWRRRQLWELRSYQEALEAERRRLVYRARLRAAYGPRWRRNAPVDQILLLKLANLGEPLPAFHLEVDRVEAALGGGGSLALSAGAGQPVIPSQSTTAVATRRAEGPAAESPQPESLPESEPFDAGGFGSEPAVSVPVPVQTASVPVPEKSEPAVGKAAGSAPAPTDPFHAWSQVARTASVGPRAPARHPVGAEGGAVKRYHRAFVDYTHRHGGHPDSQQLATWLFEQYGVKGRSGEALSPGHLRRYIPGFREHWAAANTAKPRASATEPA